MSTAGVRLSTPAALACFKGRDAAALLASAGVTVPQRPNSFRTLEGGGWCLRLGAGEYLLADDHDAHAVRTIRDRVAATSEGAACHVLVRADRCVHLEGAAATARLLQVCDIDERELLRRADALALVMLADVAVALHAAPREGAAAWRIWCDPTYAEHVLHTFAALDARGPALPFPRCSPRQDP
jgi:sarcosine oxidase gamma subunit